MRLFYAIELSTEARAALQRLIPSPSVPGARDYRWVDPALLHVTLAFLGEQPESALDALRSIGEVVAGSSRTARLSLGAAGHFGSPRAPRVLWVGIDGQLDRVADLQAYLTTRLRDGGFPVEDRPFSPHITLARRRQGAPSHGPTPWPPATPPLAVPFAVDELVLVHSQLSPRGPRYTPVEVFPLARV